MNYPLPLKVKKYLNKYSSTKWQLIHNQNIKYDCAVVVPAIAECDNLAALLNSLSENDFNKDYRVIIIFVINNFISSSLEIKKDNHKSISFLKAILENDISYHNLVKKFNSSGLHIGLVDASSDGLEMHDKTGGVGLARKTGMDLTLTVFDYDNQGRKILICLDADCIVEKNYLSEIINAFNEPDTKAAVIKFEHPLTGDEENVKAIICYEIFMRYYVLGLIFAGSPYAFHTVGSATACDHEAYIKVEGMNKQKAAEDFYFLEKLAKHYEIKKINTTTVYPSARKSWRVPFGTGQRINRFFTKSHNEYLLYNPESFIMLKRWLELFNFIEKFTADEYLQRANDIHPELCNFLIEQNFKNDWEKVLSNSKYERQIKIQKHRWFDGFRTLKLIHHLRDTAFPLINMFDALDEIFGHLKVSLQFKREKGVIPAIEVQKGYLYKLREMNSGY